MAGLVALRVVGVRAVSHVGRQQVSTPRASAAGRTGRRRGPGPGVRAPGASQSPAAPVAVVEPDLLVVVQHDDRGVGSARSIPWWRGSRPGQPPSTSRDRRVGVRRGGPCRPRAGPTAARRSTTASQDSTSAMVDAHLAGEPGPEVTRSRVAEAPHRGEVLLSVEQQAARGDVPIEVDGELGDPEHGPVRCGRARGGRCRRRRRTATRPARPRSRSSHELTSAPPYTSTPSWRKPASPVSGRGRMRRLGESVWAPIIRRGASGAVAPAQAISDPSRTTNDGSAPLPADGSAPLPADGSAPLPADGSAPLHDSVGSRSMNPASASIRRADSAAWCGVGDASMNSARRRAGAGTLMVGSSSEGTDRFRIGGASRTGAVLRRSRIFSCVSRRCDPNWCSLNFLDRG